MSNINSLLTHALHQNHYNLNKDAQEKLICYLALLTTWNRAFNLTAMTEPEEMVYLHIMDSLSVSPYLHGVSLLDVGSGAGLPGIPLAIAHPHTQWILLDKNSKKIKFLTQVISELGLTHIQAIQSRCEDFNSTQRFDSIISRAFTTIKQFTELTVHLLKPHGLFIAMKGKYPYEELSNLPKHYIVREVASILIQGMPVKRHIVCVQPVVK